jgi:uncharacterized protein involved in exopolysaccharide biosynthesis
MFRYYGHNHSYIYGPYDSLCLNTSYSKRRPKRKETQLIQIIDRPILPLEKEKLGRIKSFLLGGFLASLLTIFYLVLGRLYKNLVS